MGVAHGGTTCVILECMKEIGITAELHSVDISTECYRAPGKRTGYSVAMAFECLPEGITHFWYLGNVLPTYLEKIGDEIDFLILDTVHSMPGEMLDFLAAFPYLAPDAVVLLHDLTLNQISDNESGYATRIVYDVAVADKILADGIDPDEILPGIGAFQITADTAKYIEKCFSALAITWQYDLPDEELEHYRGLYKKFYDSILADAFDKAVAVNRKRMLVQKSREAKAGQVIIDFHKYIMSEYKIVLYGGGYWAELISRYLYALEKKVSAYVVSDYVDLTTCRIKENIFHFSDLPYPQHECCLIMAVDPNRQKDIMEKIEGNTFRHIWKGESYIYDRLAVYINNVTSWMEEGN